MNLRIYVILLFGLGGLQCGGEKEQSYTPCSIRWSRDQRQIANCSRRNISSVPQNLPHNLYVLDLSYNNLSVLLNGSFVNYRQLQILNAQYNSIAILENGTFGILHDLNNLYLKSNKIKVLPSSLFHNNVHLSKLILPRNKLRRIPNISTNMQQNVKSNDSKEQTCRWNISEINLSSNDIVKLEQEDFLSLKNCPIDSLDLSINKFTFLPHSVFIYLPPVKKLSLNSNKLDTFEVQSFMGKVTIENLHLSYARIRYIIPLNTRTSREQFPDIKILNLQSNRLVAIPDHALFGFEKLQMLVLEFNRITSIRNKSFCGLKSLTDLNLSRNRIKSLPYGSFSCANKIQKINLAYNNIFTLDPQWFDGSDLLLHLDLYKNKIGEIKSGPWNATDIQILVLAYNDLYSLHKYMFAGLIHLRRLDVSHNDRLVGTSYDTFTAEANTLEYLDMSNIEKNVVDGSFSKLHRLLHLDLSYSHIKLKIRSAHEFSNSLRTLKLSRTHLSAKDLVHSDGKTNKSVFSGLVSLYTLEMRHNSLNNLHAFPNTIFTPLRNIRKIDLTECFIRYIDSGTFANLTSLRELLLPDNSIKGISESAFRNLHKLQTLMLQYNYIPLIEKRLFNGTPNLRKLFLQSNKISTILPHTVIPPQLNILNITGNNLTCTCQLTWFREWLNKVNVDLIDTKEIYCSRDSFQNLENKTILSFHPEEYCGVDILLVAGVSVSIISALSLGILVYLKRWWLNHKLFLLKLAIIGYHEVFENKDPDDYEYQLNIMFHEDDDWWVNDCMKPFLEESMPHFEHIAFGDADLHPGSFYLDAIYDVIEGSYKTVLLLSNQAVADAWFMTKLRMAVEHMNDTKLEKVILIFLEDIDNDHLPYLVRLLLSQNKPYLLWVDDEDGRDYFWAKFQKSLRANRQMNNVIPV